jgi:hypothetical protein
MGVIMDQIRAALASQLTNQTGRSGAWSDRLKYPATVDLLLDAVDGVLTEDELEVARTLATVWNYHSRATARFAVAVAAADAALGWDLANEGTPEELLLLDTAEGLRDGLVLPVPSKVLA